MSYDLCLPQKAEKPYYIENIRTGIYSLEELCFYFYHNVCLIDASIINRTLCEWIRDELKLPRLYRELSEQLEKNSGTAFFVLPVFREIGYLTQQEMRDFQGKLNRLEGQPEDMKKKLRADYLVKEKMFAKAIWEYRQILNRKNPGKPGSQFYVAVWNNMACAYAGLFKFDRAAQCYLESYQLLKTRETFRKYISALSLYLPEEQFQSRMKEMEADAVFVREIQEYNAGICNRVKLQTSLQALDGRDPVELLDELKEEYCKSVKM